MDNFTNVNKSALTTAIITASLVGYLVYSNYNTALKTVNEIISTKNILQNLENKKNKYIKLI